MKKSKSLINLFWISIVLLNLLFVSILVSLWVGQEIRTAKEQFKNVRETYVNSQKETIKTHVKYMVDYIHHKKSLAHKRTKDHVKSRTLEAYQTALFIYNKNKKHKSLNEIKNLVHDALYAATWDRGKGYYFAEDMTGTEIVNRNNPELVGKNIFNIQDDRGNFIMQDILAVARSKEREGYCSYYWNKPNHPGVFVPKVSYVKYFEPLDWVIGNGKYITDEEEKIKREVIDRIEQINFGFGGYIFAGTWGGMSLTGPFKGINKYEFTDPNGVKIVQSLINVSKKGGGFVEYISPKYKSNDPSPKISYAEPIYDWEWYIGTGVHIDAIEPVIRERQTILESELKFLILKATVLFLVFLFISFLMAWIFSKKIKKNLALFADFFSKSAEKALPIDENEVVFTEFQSLAVSANQMASERQKAWNELTTSEQRLHQIFDASHIPLAISDADGKMLFLNKKYTALFGYTIEDIPDANAWWRYSCPDDDYRKKMKQKRMAALKDLELGQKPTKRIMINISCKDKTVKLVEIENTFADRLRLTTFHDLTEKIKIETEKRQLETKLHQAQKMEAIGLLAGGVAHDLNNILSGIISYPELLLMQLPEDSSLRNPLEAIKNSGERAANVVEDLLTVARGVAANKEPANLNALIGNYLSSLEFKTLKTLHPHISFKTDLENELFNINCSSIHINKTIMNLIINAVESINEKGNILISTRNRYIDDPFIENQYMEVGEYCVVRVKDDGQGISPNDIERIFEPFYTKKVLGKSGTGLGLSVVWNTVQDHFGSISVESCEKGTIFNLYFPATRDKLKNQIKSYDLDELKGNGEKILIIDDEEQQLKIASEMLKLLSYKPDTVSSGEEAIAYMENNTADLLVLDMIMDPGLNGRKTYEKIIQKHPGQKAIIASGFSRNDEVKNTQALGAGRFIKKPYTLNRLGTAVKEALEN